MDIGNKTGYFLFDTPTSDKIENQALNNEPYEATRKWTKYFDCSVCDERFISEDSLDHHMKNWHFFSTHNKKCTATNQHEPQPYPVRQNLTFYGQPQNQYNQYESIEYNSNGTLSKFQDTFHQTQDSLGNTITFPDNYIQMESFPKCAELTLDPIDLSTFPISPEKLLEVDRIKSLIKCLKDLERYFQSNSNKIKVAANPSKRYALWSEQSDIRERHEMFRKMLKIEVKRLTENTPLPQDQSPLVKTTECQKQQAKVRELEMHVGQVEQVLPLKKRGQYIQSSPQQHLPNDDASKNHELKTQQLGKKQRKNKESNKRQLKEKQTKEESIKKKAKFKRNQEIQSYEPTTQNAIQTKSLNFSQPYNKGDTNEKNVNKSSVLDSGDTFLIPLIKVDELDQTKLLFLKKIGVVALIPLQEIKNIGIPIKNIFN